MRIDISGIKNFASEKELASLKNSAEAANAMLREKNGKGNDFVGWVDLPVDYDKAEFSRIKKAAEKIRSDSDVLIVIGIGGSYLGSRAAIEYLYTPFYNDKLKTKIFFAGDNISSAYHADILAACEGKDISVNVISKSGTTTEPAIAFRVFKKLLEKKYGSAAKDRIYATTDKARGAMKKLADDEGYETFVIPDNIGGRYSVLTPVGLLPIAVSGADIDALMEGASEQRVLCDTLPFDQNDCLKYAAVRNLMLQNGKSIEVLSSFEPAMLMVSEWYKQLFGESEGKDGKGLFPVSMNFSTDLHSLGQYMQQGQRTMFETFLEIDKASCALTVENDEKNIDGINYLAGKTFDEINKTALSATMLAHISGGVPCVKLNETAFDEKSLGKLFYFFERACGISGYMMGVNPFDQPGVEEYKTNMFKLLGKPGYTY